MIKEDRVSALLDAAAHMSLAQSALRRLLDEGATEENGRDIVLASRINGALKTQRGAIDRRLKLGRYQW